jgi:predicted AlkP superfamily pyrophosphatase or phosphodiesterase
MNLSKLLLLFSFCYLVNQMAVAQEKTKKALFIIVDGIAADVLERVNTPYMDVISEEGAYTRAFLGGEKGGYSETPTISAVGYNSLLTGTWANKHNVWDNDIEAPNYHYWTIFRFLKTQYPEKKTAIFSTWLDNRTKLIGEGLAATGNLKMDYSFDGLELDTVNFPHDDPFYIQKIDEKVTAQAASTLKAAGPDLTWVYLQFTDNTGHDYGDSPENDRAVEIIDRQVGEIYASVKYREQHFDEDWLVFVTTDHGRKAVDGKGHGGQSEREKTIWIVTNLKKPNRYFYSSRPAIVDLLPSLADHLQIDIPREQRRELDGITLLKDISISHPEAYVQGNELVVSWEPHQSNEKVKVWLTETNDFHTSGKADNYQLVGEVDIVDKRLVYPLKKKGSFYKVVIEGQHNMLNRWVK